MPLTLPGSQVHSWSWGYRRGGEAGRGWGRSAASLRGLWRVAVAFPTGASRGCYLRGSRGQHWPLGSSVDGRGAGICTAVTCREAEACLWRRGKRIISYRLRRRGGRAAQVPEQAGPLPALQAPLRHRLNPRRKETASASACILSREQHPRFPGASSSSPTVWGAWKLAPLLPTESVEGTSPGRGWSAHSRALLAGGWFRDRRVSKAGTSGAQIKATSHGPGGVKAA